MSAEPLEFGTCEPGLSISPLAVWIAVGDRFRFRWANRPALELWQAHDIDELRAREPGEGAPERVMARGRELLARTRAGEIICEEWTFYPRGRALTLMLEFRSIRLPGGELGMLHQATPISSEWSDSFRRNVTMSRHLSIIYALIDETGAILQQNPSASSAFGSRASWLEWFPAPDPARAMLRSALADEPTRRLLQVSPAGPSQAPGWHMVEAQPLRDPVTGKLGVLVEHEDQTARTEAEHLAREQGEEIDSLHTALELVERQRQEILALSAPHLDVGAHTLAVPIIGRFDEQRSAEITLELLEAVATRRVRRVILDLTGVATLDPASVGRLRQMLGALRMLGAQPTITGIRPPVARELVGADLGLGLGLGDVSVARTLAEALER